MFSRIRRKDFLFYAVLLIILNYISIVIIENLDKGQHGFENYNLVVVILLVISIPLALILTAKRLHDINLSGWFSLLLLIPFLNFVFLLLYFIDGTIGDNKYGEDPKKRFRKLNESTNSSSSNIDVIKNNSKYFLGKTADLISKNFNQLKKSTEIKLAKTFLIGANWILLSDNQNDEIIYIFRSNNDLVISNNGFVEIQRYDFITNNNTLLITNKEKTTELYDIVNFKDDLLIIKRKSNNSYLFFINTTKVKEYINKELLNNLKNRYS